MIGNTFLDFLNNWSSRICAIILEYFVDLLSNIDSFVVGRKSLNYLLQYSLNILQK